MPLPTAPAAIGPHRRPPAANGAPVLQPIGVALITAMVSAAALFVLIRCVLLTGGGIPMVAGVVGCAAIVLVVMLRLLFHRIGSRSGWPTATILTAAGVVVYLALLMTGTQGPSIVSLRPEAIIAAVALACGAASTIARPGWSRVVGIIGGACLLWLALTPVLVAL